MEDEEKIAIRPSVTLGVYKKRRILFGSTREIRSVGVGGLRERKLQEKRHERASFSDGWRLTNLTFLRMPRRGRHRGVGLVRPLS